MDLKTTQMPKHTDKPQDRPKPTHTKGKDGVVRKVPKTPAVVAKTSAAILAAILLSGCNGAGSPAVRQTSVVLQGSFNSFVRPQAEIGIEARIASGELTPAEANFLRGELDEFEATIVSLRGDE